MRLPRYLHAIAHRSGGSCGDRSVRFRLAAESQDSLFSVASTGGVSDTFLRLTAGPGVSVSREASVTAGRQADPADGPASSQRSLDPRGGSRRGVWPRLGVDKPELTPVRSSGTFTRDMEGSFRPVLPAVRDRSLAMPAGEAT